MAIPSLLTVKQFSQKHPAFPEGSLRHLIFHAASNGLANSGALVRNGKRVLIDEGRFFSWLQERSAKSQIHEQLELDFCAKPSSTATSTGDNP